MSVHAMTWARVQQHVKDAPSRHVLLCLANYANENGRGAYPSVRTLAEDTGLTERTVQNKLAGLKQSGMIRRGNQAITAARISRSDRRPVVYDLVMDRSAATGGDAHDLHPVNVTGCISGQDGVQLTTERGARASPNTSLIRQVNEKPRRADAALPSAARGARLPPDWAPSPELTAWALGQPGVTTGVLANEMAKFGDYWRAMPGSKGVKLDWSATFRNWIRNIKGVSNGSKECGGSLVDRAAGRAREIFAGT